MSEMQEESSLEMLVRQGSDSFPPGWGKRMTDAAYWRPSMEAICSQHGLRLDSEIVLGKEGGNAVFLAGDLVIKIYAAPWPLWYSRELECLRALNAVPAAGAPRLLAYGPAAGGDADHPYLVIERLPGRHLSEVWADLTLSDRCSVAEQTAVLVRALHSVPVSDLKAFSLAPEDWVRRMRARAEGCAEYLSRGPHLPLDLLAQVPAYFEANLAAITADFTPRLLSADIHQDHILVEERNGRWKVTGHIDFGDADVGPVEYEWIALCLDAFRSDTAPIRAFFEAYGWRLPLDRATRQRLKLYTLLHTFADPIYNAGLAGISCDVPDLDALLDQFWTV